MSSETGPVVCEGSGPAVSGRAMACISFSAREGADCKAPQRRTKHPPPDNEPRSGRRGGPRNLRGAARWTDFDSPGRPEIAARCGSVPEPLKRSPLGVLERLASHWESQRFSRLPPEASGRSRITRENERSLVTRVTLCHDASFLEAFNALDPFGALPDPVQRIARAPPASIAGIFRIDEHDGARLIVTDASTSSRIEINDPIAEIADSVIGPSDGIERRVGELMFGRLIPLDDDVYMRSPGAIFIVPSDVSLFAVFARAFDWFCNSLPQTLAIEAVLTKTLASLDVPGEVAPAASRSEARQFAHEILEALIDASVAKAAPLPETLAREPDASAGRFTAFDFPLDETLASWVSALQAMAEGRSSGSARSRGRARARRRKRCW